MEKVEKNLRWTHAIYSNIRSVKTSNSKWKKSFDSVFNWLLGMKDGYSKSVSLISPLNVSKILQSTQFIPGFEQTSIELTLTDFHLLNSSTDIGEVLIYKWKLAKIDVKSKLEDLLDFKYTKDKCSCLIKLTADYSDLIAAHTTWTDYISTIR
mmetsp:Transcript_16061/g.35242  ORF Transcript_16061/g.35242 Transcript_16061/m.35242 type:complete len:153 (+) Transcript_16061:328-786(+)